MQEIAVFVVGAIALGYLVMRYARKRATGNCCGEKECPAAREMVDKIERLR